MVFCNWSHSEVQVHSQHLRYKLTSSAKPKVSFFHLSAFQCAVKSNPPFKKKTAKKELVTSNTPQPEGCASLILIVFPTLGWRTKAPRHQSARLFKKRPAKKNTRFCCLTYGILCFRYVQVDYNKRYLVGSLVFSP